MSNHQRILRGISIGGAIVTAVLVVLLIISVFVSIFYDTRSQVRRVTPILDEHDIQLQFDSPLYLFQQEASTAFHVNVWSDDTLTLPQTVTVRLTVPEGIQVVTPTINANDRVVVLTFLPEDGAVQNGRVYLQNAGTVTSTSTQRIMADSTLHTNILSIPIKLNSPWQAAIGSFFRNSLSNNGPILLVIAAVGTIMAQLLQNYQRQEELAQKRNELEENKNLAALELALTIRKHLVEKNAPAVKHTWLQLNALSMRRRLPAHEQEWLALLTTLATCTAPPDYQVYEDSISLVAAIQLEWPDEYAGAIVCLQENMRGSDDQIVNPEAQLTLEKWTKTLKFYQIKNTELSGEWIQIRSSLPRETQDYVPNIEDDLRPDKLIPEDEPYPPLAHKHAEDEEQTLYIKNAFWPGNPAYDEFLNNENRNQIIFGVSGSGLTALAKGIWVNESRWTPYFWSYIAIYPGIDSSLNPINTALSGQLLKYLFSKPLRLTALRLEQRNLLAEVLVQEFSPRLLCAKIARISDQAHWRVEAPVGYEDEWHEEGKIQLTLLANNIREQVDKETLSSQQFLNALIEIYNSLGFKQLRLLFDFAPNTVELAEKMIDLWAEWHSHDVISTFFLPAPVKKNLKLDKNKIHQIELAWDTEQLDELIKHRYYRISRQRPAWRYIGGDLNKYKAFLESLAQLDEPPTPRLLIERLHGEEVSVIEEDNIEVLEISGRNRFFDWALTHFSKADLEIVSYKLGVDPDHVKSETTPQFLMSIIQDSESKTNIENLLKVCKEMRPVNWPGFESWE